MTIEKIKQNLSILSVVQHYGHTPNRHHLLRCPFHQDDKPSLQLYPSTNTWHCFGCGKGTDGIDFIKLKENCSTHEAILKAEKLTNHSPIKSTYMETTEIKPLAGPKRILTLETAFKYFVQSLKATAKAQQYLQSRAIDYSKVIAGYDSHNFHKAKARPEQSEGTTREQQQLYLDSGLIFPDRQGRKDSYHSRFNGCIVFPTFDEQGNIVSMYGRKIDVKEGEGGHYKLPGEHQGLYPKYPDPDTEILLITECIIDASTLLQHDFITEKYTLLSLYGAKIWTEEHSNAIQNLHQLKEIIFALDGDKEGREGTQKHAETVKQIHPKIKISYLEIPEGEDLNSIAQGHENPQVFAEFIQNRKIINSHPTNFFLSQEKQENDTAVQEVKENGIPEIKQTEPANGDEKTAELPLKEKNGTLEIKAPEKEKSDTESPEVSTAKPPAVQVSEASQPLNTNGQEKHPATGKLTTGNPITYETETLRITLQGGIELYNLKRLRVTLHLQLKANSYNDYRDTVDLYSHSQRKRLIEEISEKIEISATEISRVLSDFTNQLETYRREVLERKRQEEETERRKNEETFTQEEMQAGERLLKDKNLMGKTEAHINNIGLVGEEEKGMLLFFILLTRMFKDPLHALVQGKTGSGKTYLLKKIAGLLPKVHLRIATALTENTLYHSIKGFWKHVVLLIEDLDGVISALLALREMMSNQSISKFSTEKDLKTGEFKQMLLYVEGPICVAGATTKDKFYEDNANRSFLIQVNESAEYQERAMEHQRKDLSGLIDKSKEQETQMILKTAQLNLEYMEVVIPFGEELKIPDYVFKKLRTNAHYLILIKAIAFWNQKQREIKIRADGTRYIEATLEDVAWANRLSKEVLLRKSDELTGALRGFFESIKEILKMGKEESFYSKPLREKLRMNPMQVNRYLKELEQRGYLKQIGGNRKTGFEYQVAIWDDYEQLKQGMNILDEVLEKLRKKYGK